MMCTLNYHHLVTQRGAQRHWRLVQFTMQEAHGVAKCNADKDRHSPCEFHSVAFAYAYELSNSAAAWLPHFGLEHFCFVLFCF